MQQERAITFYGWDQLDLEAFNSTRKDDVTNISILVEIV